MEEQIFIDSQRANQLLDENAAYIVDASWVVNEDTKARHFQSRIRGAKFFNISEIRDTTSQISLDWPTLQQFTESMARLGLPNDGKIVIVYDQAGIGTAARAWFMLKYFGYHNVHILDGGLPKWTAESRPTESGEYETSHEATDLSLYHFSENRDMRVLIDAVEEVVNHNNAGDASTQIWDPRPPNMFQSGAVPTAVNYAVGGVFNPDKTVKSREEVKQLLEQNGIRTEGPIISSCMKGNNASLGYVLQRYVGNHQVKVYTGSFEEWKKFKVASQ